MACLTFTFYIKGEMVTQLVDLSPTWLSEREVCSKFNFFSRFSGLCVKLFINCC